MDNQRGRGQGRGRGDNAGRGGPPPTPQGSHSTSREPPYQGPSSQNQPRGNPGRGSEPRNTFRGPAFGSFSSEPNQQRTQQSTWPAELDEKVLQYRIACVDLSTVPATVFPGKTPSDVRQRLIFLMDLPNFAHLVPAARERMESLRSQVREQIAREQAQRQAPSAFATQQAASPQLPQYSTPRSAHGPGSSMPMALRPQQPPVVEFGKATSSTTKSYSELIPQSIKEAAADKHKEIRACKVTQTCTSQVIKLRNGNYLTKSLEVGEGQEGFTLGGIELDDNGNRWLQFAVARTDIVGWVQADFLEMGQIATQCKVINVDESPVPNVSTQHNDSVLYKTVSLLCATIVADKENLSKLGANIADIEQLGREVGFFPTEFMISMPGPVRQKMDGGQFTVDDLWAIAPGASWVESTDDRRVVIYVILFKGLDGKVGTLGHGFYNGKTTNASNRHAQHWRNLADPNATGQMYAATRPKHNEAGRQYRMLVLCDFTAEADSQQQQKLLKYAEHTCVCLFSSWTKILTSDTVDDIALLAKFYFDRAMARAFKAVMEKVSRQTKWQIPVGKGLNWVTPLTEAHLRRSAWTCTIFTPDTKTGPIRSYRSGPRKTHVNTMSGSTVVSLFTGGADRRGKVQIALGTGIDWPKVVTIIVEIYGKGKRHPVPYARFPEPGPFDVWGEFNSIGIKARWLDPASGQLKEKWIQPDSFPFEGLGWPLARQKTLSPASAEAYPFASLEFVKMLLIRDTLLQVEYDKKPDRPVFDFIKSGPGLVVKVIEYSHLDQTIYVRNQQPIKRLPPRLVSVNENRLALKKMYGDAVFFSPQPGLQGFRLDAVPGYCALCAQRPQQSGNESDGYVQLKKEKCTNSAEQPCFYCKWLRRPCVWIMLAELGRYDLNNRYRFIRPPPTDQSGVHTIPVPIAMYESLYAPTEDELADALLDDKNEDDD